MITKKLSSKNQVTIPKVIRKQLGIKSHQVIGFKLNNGKIELCKPKKQSTHQDKVRKFWKKMSQNTRKYGSDDTSYDWGQDVGVEKLDKK